VAVTDDPHQTLPPHLSLDEIALIAVHALEVIDAPDLETVTAGSDWVLAVARRLAWTSAVDAESAGSPRVDALRERLRALDATIAASPFRSPASGPDAVRLEA
jgi:hypothetical protein